MKRIRRPATVTVKVPRWPGLSAGHGAAKSTAGRFGETRSGPGRVCSGISRPGPLPARRPSTVASCSRWRVVPFPGLYHDRHPMMRSKGPPCVVPCLQCRRAQVCNSWCRSQVGRKNRHARILRNVFPDLLTEADQSYAASCNRRVPAKDFARRPTRQANRAKCASVMSGPLGA